MDYKAVIEDLNADICEEFDSTPLENGFEYTYATTGGVDRILFAGVEVFDSEKYQIDNTKDIDSMSLRDFEDYIESKVVDTGVKFLKYSFNPNPRLYKTAYDGDYLTRFIKECFGNSLYPWQVDVLKRMIANS